MNAPSCEKQLTKLLFSCMMCSVIVLQKLAWPATRGVPAGTPLLFFQGEFMITEKAVLSIEEQLFHLKNNKHLIIHDSDYARSMLEQIGYFALITGYKTPFKNPTTRNYRDGVSFDDIVALYHFDKELREIFLKYILQIERHIRALISYHFTQKHGAAQTCYLHRSNFSSKQVYAKGIARLISTLGHLANQNSDYPYINHQRHVHGNVPLWVLVNGVSLGTLSKFYQYTTPDIQTKVSKHFVQVNEKQLEQFLSVITKFRNVCAHGERLFSYQTKDAIPNTVLHKKLGITPKGSSYTCGKHDLFALVISLRYLLPNKDFLRFKTQLITAINRFLSASTAFSEQELYRYMGFPKNWKSIARYKK